jgi:GNAT superfamily N-acetyltransferase
MIIEPCKADDIRTAPNFDGLAEEYAREAKITEMPWPRVNWEIYELMEKVGSLHVFAARQHGTLAGFVFMITTMMPEYGVHLGFTEAFFVAGQYRSTGAGLKLLAAAENKVRELGILGLAVNAPVGGRLIEVLPRRGFREVGRTFFKRCCDA